VAYKRLFTLEEARSLVPDLRPRLQEMARIWSDLLPMQSEIRSLEERAQRGGGTLPATGEYLRHIEALNVHFAFLRKAGVELKDLATGLVDFPSVREGRVVYLCWRMEEETVTYWHEVEAGFAGRRRIEGSSPGARPG